MRSVLLVSFAGWTTLGPVASPLTAQGAGGAAAFTVGTATARRGETAFGVIPVPAGVDSATALHVAVVHGTRPGPVVAFVAGSHGTEYASVAALQRFIHRLDPGALTGTVIVAPLLNVPSIERMVPHINPVDGKGMNAAYPGDPKGTQTERALALFAEQVVRRSDVIVDLHGGDLDEDLRPYSYWIRTGRPAQDSLSRELALAFGLDLIIVRDVDVMNPASTRNLSGYALSLGKTAFVAEAGRAGLTEPEAVAALIEGSNRVLGALRMSSHAVPKLERVVWATGDQRVRAEKGGMFWGAVDRGSYVVRGQRVGSITDYLGREVGDVLAPQTGVVTFIRPVPSLAPGATLVTVVRLLGDTPPPWQKPAP